MLVEMYLFFAALAFVCFGIGFFNRTIPLVWAVPLILFALLAVSSYNVESIQQIYDPATLSYTPMSTSYSYAYMSWIMILFFVFSMTLLIIDIISLYKEFDTNDTMSNLVGGVGKK